MYSLILLTVIVKIISCFRLSRCLITHKGCSFLASALKSNPSYLKQLDLSCNHPGDSGVRELSDRLNDPSCKLETFRWVLGVYLGVYNILILGDIFYIDYCPHVWVGFLPYPKMDTVVVLGVGQWSPTFLSPRSPTSALVTGKIYLLRRWEEKPVQIVLTTWGFLFCLIVIKWNQTLWSSFQIDVTKNTLNDLISVQHKKEIIC